MQNKVLSEDLDNCLIDFDSRVVISDLLNEYGGKLLEISELLKNAVEKEEKNGKKFKKLFLVKGLVDDDENEIIAVIEETELSSLHEEIRDIEAYLYCVEPHGAKLFPWVFNPVRHPTIRLKNIQRPEASTSRDVPKNITTNGKTIKEAVELPKNGEIDKPNTSKNNEGETKSVNKNSKISPKNNKQEKKPLQKQGIQNFFSASDSKTKPPIKKEVVSKKAPIDYFKKQEPKPKTIPKPESTPKKPVETKKELPMVINESSSSDDEEAREALKRELYTDDEEEVSKNPKVKRRRIVESDEDDVKEVIKDEQVDEEENIKPVEIKTFQDEDGFMITVKDKIKKKTPQKRAPLKKSPKKKSPPFGKSTKKEPLKTPAKTKQGSITSFFNKK